jgi:hypothetical protein
MFWKVCAHCKGKGEVLPQSLAARRPPKMSGEIVDYTVSVCKFCGGCGMKLKKESE